MQSFQERFKGRSSSMGKTGELEINRDRAIIRPTPLQLHSPVIKTSAMSIVDPSFSSIATRVSSTIANSTSTSYSVRQYSQAPSSSPNNPLDDSPLARHRPSDYESYTVQPYYSIRMNKYYAQATLESPGISNETWGKKKSSGDRNQYGDLPIRLPRNQAFKKSGIREKSKSTAFHARNLSAFT